MTQSKRIVPMLVMFLALMILASPGAVWAQAKSELTVALSSFSAETLDPALQGHNVKYYLSLMFDYLVGTTPDGQPSQQGGLATQVGELGRPQALDVPSPQGREVPHRRRDDVGGREVQPPARDGQALHHRLRGAAADADPGHRDAGARPRGHRHQGVDAHHPDLPVALAVDRGDGAAEEVHRGQRRRRVRPQAGRHRPLQVRRAGGRLPHQADRRRQPLAHRHAEVQEHDVQAGAGGDHAHRAAAPRRGGRGRRQPRAREGAGEGGLPDPHPQGGGPRPHVVGARPRRLGGAHEGQARARGVEPRHRPQRDRAVDLRGLRRAGRDPDWACRGRSRTSASRSRPRWRTPTIPRAPRSSSPTPDMPNGFALDMLRLPAARLPRGQGLRGGDCRLLGEDRREAQAHPGGLPGLPQALGRPQGAGRDRATTTSPTATGSAPTRCSRSRPTRRPS